MTALNESYIGHKFFSKQLTDIISILNRVAVAMEKMTQKYQALDKCGFLVLILAQDCDYEFVGFRHDLKEATKLFLDTCACHISNWDNYSQDDVQAILEEGYEKFGSKAIILMDLSNCNND